MKPRITVITIGVDDLDVSLRFYLDGLGFPTEGIIGKEFEYGAVVFIQLQPGLRLALWPRKSIRAICMLLGLLLTMLMVVKAEELPSANSKPLSEILKSVEMQKLGVISEAEYDDGLWEVNVCDVVDCQKLYIDPGTGMTSR